MASPACCFVPPFGGDFDFSSLTSEERLGALLEISELYIKARSELTDAKCTITDQEIEIGTLRAEAEGWDDDLDQDDDDELAFLTVEQDCLVGLSQLAVAAQCALPPSKRVKGIMNSFPLVLSLPPDAQANWPRHIAKAWAIDEQNDLVAWLHKTENVRTLQVRVCALSSVLELFSRSAISFAGDQQ